MNGQRRRSALFLAVVLEHLLEAAACEEDAALHSAERKIHLLGDLIVFVACHVHGEGDAVAVAEGADSGGDFVGGQRTLGGVKSAFLREVEVVEILGLVNHCGRAHHFAVVVDEDVAHDGEHPSLEVDVVNVLVLVVEGFQCGVLKQVVCVVAVAGKHVSEAQKIALESDKL